MPPTVRRALALLLVCLSLGALTGCEQQPTDDPPGEVEALLALVPGEVVRERALYYSDLRVARGFGTVLPLTASNQVLGVPVDAFTDVLETGGTPLTLLAGEIDPAEVEQAVLAQGYGVEAGEEWLRFGWDGSPPASAPPLVSAVPSGAVRDGVLVLGSSEEVGLVVAGSDPLPWAGDLLEVVGAAAAIALDGRTDPLAEATRRNGTGVETLLDQHRVSGRLAAYEAAAVSWHPNSPFDDVRSPAGVVAMSFPPGTALGDQAATLAVRAATAPILGETRRAMRDLVEGGAPRFDDELGVVHLPIRWVAFDARAFRRDLDSGNLLFLAPGGEAG